MDKIKWPGRIAIAMTLVIAAHLWISLPVIFREKAMNFSSNANYFGDFYRRVSFIKNTTPDESVIIFPPQKPEFIPMGGASYCDFFLFPRLSLDIGGPDYKKNIAPRTSPVYRVVMKGFEYRGPYVDRYALDGDFALALLKKGEGQPGPRVTDYSDIVSNFPNTALAMLKLFLIILSGAWLVAKYFDEHSLLGFLTTSFLTGSTVSTVIYILLSAMNVSFTETLQFIILGLISIPGIRYLPRHRSVTVSPEKLDTFSILSGTIVSLVFSAIFITSAFSLIGAWDTINIWGIKAKVIFAFHDLKCLRAWGAYPPYPPLWPVVLSQAAVGGEAAVKFLFPVPAVCLYAILFGEMRSTRYPRALKTALPMILLLAPIFFDNSINGYANLALTAFVAKAAFMLPKLIKEPARNAWIAFSIILSGIVLVRPDGISWAACLVVPAFLYLFLTGHSRKNLAYLLIPFSCTLLWLAYVLFIMKQPLWTPSPVSKSFFSLRTISKILNWDHMKAVSLNLLKYSLSFEAWGLINISFLMLALLKGSAVIKRHLPASAFLLSGFAWILFVSYAFTIERWPVEFYFRTSFCRYIMPVIPIAFVILLKDLDSGNTSKSGGV